MCVRKYRNRGELHVRSWVLDLRYSLYLCEYFNIRKKNFLNLGHFILGVLEGGMEPVLR